jgi:hypothetical protein
MILRGRLISILTAVIVLGAGTMAPEPAHAGFFVVTCGGSNSPTNKPPFPTVWCQTLVVVGGAGQSGSVQYTYACSPNCFIGEPVFFKSSIPMHTAIFIDDQITGNCTGSLKVGLVGGLGIVTNNNRGEIVITSTASDAAVGDIPVYCPGGPSGHGGPPAIMEN